MSEPTADDLARIGRRWSSYAGMGEPRSADDYDDAGCRILAEAAFRDVPRLLALVAAQAEQIARVRALHKGWHVCANITDLGATDYSDDPDDGLQTCPTIAALDGEATP